MSRGAQWSHWARSIRGEQPSDDPARLEIWGYTGKPSYASGETLSLHVSTTASRFDIRIYRDGATLELIYERTAVEGAFWPTPAHAYAEGCGWPPSAMIAVDESWRSGGYVVELRAEMGSDVAVQDGFFVVRPSAGRSRSAVALVLATYTWQEYNDWGGGSGYSLDRTVETGVSPGGAGACEDPRATQDFSPRLSYDRPWARGLIRLPSSAPRMTVREPPPAGWPLRLEHAEWALANGYSHWCGMAGWARHDGLFVKWAESNGYEFDFLTQWDLDQADRLLDRYSAVVTVGHDEYWSAHGRAQLDEFITNGGRYARLAGNIFWRVRLEGPSDTQVCYKYEDEEDPLFHDRQASTGAFESQTIAQPPVTTFGANGARGIYARMGGSSPRGIGGFVVYRNEHWAFKGTDLYYGDVLGSSVPLVGYEVDGLTYTFREGLPHPTGEDGAPAALEILALTPASHYEEDHGIPGSVFAVGDADLAMTAKMLLGNDTPADRERVKRGAAVVTWMNKGRGEVFCGGSTEWPYALSQGDPMVEQVVRNVLDRFSQRQKGSA